MAKLKKTDDTPDWISYGQRRIEQIKTLPLLAERWSVVEVTPSKCIDHHWDDWSREEHRTVSPYFSSKDELDSWIEKYEPDEGNHFKIEHEYLREYTEQRWGSI